MSDWRPLEGRLAGWACGEGPRLVFVHGFTQTANSWKPIAARFAADGYEAVVVDVPGHGDSANIRADLREGADKLMMSVSEINRAQLRALMAASELE